MRLATERWIVEDTEFPILRRRQRIWIESGMGFLVRAPGEEMWPELDMELPIPGLMLARSPWTGLEAKSGTRIPERKDMESPTPAHRALKNLTPNPILWRNNSNIENGEVEGT